MIETMFYRDLQGHSREFHAPNWAEVRRAVESLNGGKVKGTRSELTFVRTDDSVMTIGDGSGVFVATIVDHKGFVRVLSNGGDDSRIEDLIVGGQLTPCEHWMIVPLDIVLSAASVFFETGEATHNVCWK